MLMTTGLLPVTRKTIASDMIPFFNNQALMPGVSQLARADRSKKTGSDNEKFSRHAQYLGIKEGRRQKRTSPGRNF